MSGGGAASPRVQYTRLWDRVGAAVFPAKRRRLRMAQLMVDSAFRDDDYRAQIDGMLRDLVLYGTAYARVSSQEERAQ